MADEHTARGWPLVFRQPAAISEPVHPVVRIVFRYRRGVGHGLRHGSGFFVSRWPNVVLTAAHVVEVEDVETPVRARVTIWSADRARSYVMSAKAMAYPEPLTPERDIAALLLPIQVPQIEPAVEAFAAPNESFEGTLEGVVTGLRRHPILGRLNGAFIDYEGGTSHPQMSGGPLYWKEAGAAAKHVVGVHHRGRTVGADQNDVQGSAWALDSTWLNACLKAAETA